MGNILEKVFHVSKKQKIQYAEIHREMQVPVALGIHNEI
jgi:hypothetical protein